MNLICKQVILPSKMKNDLGCQFSERLTPREQLDGMNNFALNNIQSNCSAGEMRNFLCLIKYLDNFRGNSAH